MSFVPTELTKGFTVKTQQGYHAKHERKLALPPHQTVASEHAEGLAIVNCGAPRDLFTSGVAFKYNLMRGNDVKRIKSIWIKVDVQIINANCQLVPVTHFFDQINVRHSGEPNIIRSYYPDASDFSLFSFMNDEKLSSASTLLNIDDRKTSIFGLDPVISANQKRSFYLPLFGNIFENMDVNWNTAIDSLEFEFVPPKEGIVAFGTATNVVCDGLSLVIDRPINDEYMQVAQDAMEAKYTKTVNFLDPVRISTYNNTLLTVGQKTDLDLSTLNGNFSHLMIQVRNPGSSNVNWTKGVRLNLGDEGGATINILDEVGNSIYSAAFPTKYLVNGVVASQMESEAVSREAFYVLPFCKNVVASLQGTFLGSYRFKAGTKRFLSIVPQPGVDEVQTITASAIPDDGNFRFFLEGEFSAPLAYNATFAQMKAAFEAMTFCKRRGITVTFAGAWNTGLSCTIKNPTTNGLEQRIITVIGNNLNAAGVEVTANTVLTTSGYAGLATGNYDISIIAWCQKRAYWFNKVVTELA